LDFREQSSRVAPKALLLSRPLDRVRPGTVFDPSGWLRRQHGDRPDLASAEVLHRQAAEPPASTHVFDYWRGARRQLLRWLHSVPTTRIPGLCEGMAGATATVSGVSYSCFRDGPPARYAAGRFCTRGGGCPTALVRLAVRSLARREPISDRTRPNHAVLRGARR
jgi:hypothetical protein